MKPVVIVKDQNGNVQLTVEEVKKMVEDAYDAGYADGKSAIQYYPIAPIAVPDLGYPNGWKVTCNTVTDMTADMEVQDDGA